MIRLALDAGRNLASHRRPWFAMLWPLFLGTAAVDALTERLLDTDNPLSLGAGDLPRLGRFLLLYCLGLLLALVVSNFACIIFYRGYGSLERGEPVTVKGVYRDALGFFHRMLLLNIWVYMRVAIGLVLLVIPGAYLFFSFQFASFNILDRPGSNRQAMARSATCFSRQPARLAGYLVFGFGVYAVTWLASMVAGEMARFILPQSGAWCIKEAVDLLGSAWLWVYRIAVYKKIAIRYQASDVSQA